MNKKAENKKSILVKATAHHPGGTFSAGGDLNWNFCIRIRIRGLTTLDFDFYGISYDGRSKIHLLVVVYGYQNPSISRLLVASRIDYVKLPADRFNS